MNRKGIKWKIVKNSDDLNYQKIFFTQIVFYDETPNLTWQSIVWLSKFKRWQLSCVKEFHLIHWWINNKYND